MVLRKYASTGLLFQPRIFTGYYRKKVYIEDNILYKPAFVFLEKSCGIAMTLKLERLIGSIAYSNFFKKGSLSSKGLVEGFKRLGLRQYGMSTTFSSNKMRFSFLKSMAIKKSNSDLNKRKSLPFQKQNSLYRVLNIKFCFEKHKKLYFKYASRLKKRFTIRHKLYKIKQQFKNAYGFLPIKQIKLLRKRSLIPSVFFKQKFAHLHQLSSEERFFIFLEFKLDTLLVRSNFVQSFYEARFFISHFYIIVNGEAINSSFFNCNTGDLIGVKNNMLHTVFLNLFHFFFKKMRPRLKYIFDNVTNSLVAKQPWMLRYDKANIILIRRIFVLYQFFWFVCKKNILKKNILSLLFKTLSSFYGLLLFQWGGNYANFLDYLKIDYSSFFIYIAKLPNLYSRIFYQNSKKIFFTREYMRRILYLWHK
jgi:ribosomal protein S4